MNNSKKCSNLSVKLLASVLSVITLFPGLTSCANAANAKQEVRSENSIVRKIKDVGSRANSLAKRGWVKISTWVKEHPKTTIAIGVAIGVAIIGTTVGVVCYKKSHKNKLAAEEKAKKEAEEKARKAAEEEAARKAAEGQPEEKDEEKVEEKVEEKPEEKDEEKVEEKPEEKDEEKPEEKVEEKVEEKPEEKAARKAAEEEAAKKAAEEEAARKAAEEEAARKAAEEEAARKAAEEEAPKIDLSQSTGANRLNKGIRAVDELILSGVLDKVNRVKPGSREAEEIANRIGCVLDQLYDAKQGLERLNEVYGCGMSSEAVKDISKYEEAMSQLGFPYGRVDFSN